LVVPASSEIVLALAPDSAPAFFTLDGQRGHALHPGDRLLCRNSPYVLTLLTPAPASFFGSLRAKLNWA
ncbi:MAG: NAD(+) kinase, partial [Chloroflexota bacterium]